MLTLTFDQVLDQASRLPRTQRAELIARLVRDLAAEPAQRIAVTSDDAWERLQQFREELYRFDVTLPHGLAIRPPPRLRRGGGAGACGPAAPRYLFPGAVSLSYEQAEDGRTDAEGRRHIGIIRTWASHSHASRATGA